MNTKTTVISQAELDAQFACCDKIAAYWQTKGRTPTAYVETYGCQQNEADSEKLRGYLAEMGYGFTQDEFEADVIVVNTCAVREHAEMRVLGNVGQLNHSKKQRPGQIIAVCGCMVQQEHMVEKIKKSYPVVDLVFGPHELWRFPELLLKTMTSHKRVFAAEKSDGAVAEGMPLKRDSSVKAWLSIMYGCNNFCTYCVVPYVRGRERSRRPEDIVAEARELVAAGCKDITLLGQNVNSYGLDVEGELSFAQLLSELDKVGIERIRFMTSHPKDISDELIDVMASGKHICHALHLPVQHGNNRILQSMNRRYTREKYLERVEAIRSKVPDISLTTDLIVGYPGETEEEFEETCSLVEQVGYDSAFTFIYSPRVGTRAADMPDQIPEEVSSRRIQKLIALQKDVTHKRYANYIGQVHSVLVEESSRRDENQMAGKNEYNITVNFPGDKSLIGQIVRVKITSAGESTLRGERVE
mgnify:CR=1 FL=1